MDEQPGKMYEQPKTDEEWGRQLECLEADDRRRIRVATRWCIRSLLVLLLAILGMVLVSPGQPLRPFVLILGPLVAVLAFSSAMTFLISLAFILYSWAFGLHKPEDLSRRR
jgi:hypothetical protein